jgi:hypothetical protein
VVVVALLVVVVVVAFEVFVGVVISPSPPHPANTNSIKQAARNIAAIFLILFLPLFCRNRIRLVFFAVFSHGFYKGYYEEPRRFLCKQIFTKYRR